MVATNPMALDCRPHGCDRLMIQELSAARPHYCKCVGPYDFLYHNVRKRTNAFGALPATTTSSLQRSAPTRLPRLKGDRTLALQIRELALHATSDIPGPFV